MKPIGVFVAEIMAKAERLHSFQMRLNDMATDRDRKQAIIHARSDGFLTHEETELLIQSYGVEEA